MLRWLLRMAEFRAVRIAFLGLAITMTVNLFYLGAGPGAVGLFVPPWDKVAHFVAFSVLTVLLAVGIGVRRPWLTLAVVASVGMADELHQVWLPGRSAGADDWIVDVMAGLFVVGLIWMMRSVAARGNPTIDPVR